MVPRLPMYALNLSRTTHCSFSTSSTCLKVRTTDPLRLIPKGADAPPAYPYGPALWYKQSDSGLYGGVSIAFGNNVAPKSAVKTRRKWKPNIKHKKLYSQALDRMVTIKLSTRVLRTIDKVGGLDEYLLTPSSARMKELGMEGWRWRWLLLQTPTIQERMKTDIRLRKAAKHMEAFTQRELGAVPAVAVKETILEPIKGLGETNDLEKPKTVAKKVPQDGEQGKLERRITDNISRHMYEKPASAPKGILARIKGMFSRK